MFFSEPESNTLEWKQQIPAIPKLLKTVIGFANQFGGKIIIGIKDNGSIVGVQPSEIHHALEMLSQAIFENCTPNVVPHIYPVEMNQKTLLVIEIAEGMSKPYFIKSLGIAKGTFVRIGRSSMLATSEMFEELKWRARGRCYDELPIYSSSLKDLSSGKLNHFLDSYRKINTKLSNIDALKHYRLVREESGHTYPTIGGLLLFGNDPQTFLHEAKIYCSHFKGISGRDAIAHIECAGDLFQQYQAAMEFLERQIPKYFQIRGKQREEHLFVPPVALREALTNILVHRDYSLSAPSKIAIFSDRVEFFSPGVFPGPFSKRIVESGFTYIRNYSITNIFHQAKLIERLGTGFATIFRAYREVSDIEPDILDGDGFVKCVLPFLPQNLNEDRDEAQEAEHRALIRLVRRYENLTAEDVERELRVSRSTAVRMLRKAVKDKIIQRKSRGPQTHYVLSS